MALKKKASGKKAAKKKATPRKKKTATPGIKLAFEPGDPCICEKKADGWWCMKKENGKLIPCHGPYRSKKACEQKTCG